MPHVQFVGRPSLHFYGKYLSEISKNLRNRAVGRVVIKESEAAKYSEPCFYVLERVTPLLSDETNVRCRAWGRRYFRGHDFGSDIVPGTHEPDWRLASLEEAHVLLSRVSSKNAAAPLVGVSCVAPMPPLLALHLLQNNRLPKSVVDAANKTAASMGKGLTRNAHGYLILAKLPDDPTLMMVPIEPTLDEQSRVHPPYSIASSSGLVNKVNLDRDAYYIQRSDTPGLYWKVFTKKVDDTVSAETSPSE